MDKDVYEAARVASKGLFDNALVLPVALAISREINDGASFEIGHVREELGGRAAETSIRNALKRLTSTGALHQLVSLGPPHPDVWERRPHPLWTFAPDWARELNGGAPHPHLPQ